MNKIVLLLVSICLLMPFSFFGQTNDLGKTFAKRYLTISAGEVSATSKLIFSSNPSTSYPKTTAWDKSFSVGFGYRLNKIKSNFYLEYNLSNNRYWNYTIYTRASTNNTIYSASLIFHWVHEIGVKDYIPLYKNIAFFSIYGGINATTTRASKPNSEFNYDPIDDNWFLYSSPRIKPGCYAGFALNCRIGKRLMLFGQYKFQTEFSNNIYLGEIKYIGLNGQESDYFKSKVLPYNQAVLFGISFSLENSGFYK
jgi:hypothetical protein